MKVLIHALGADMGGAVRHLRGFLPELARQAPGDQFTVLVRDGGVLGVWPANVRPHVVPSRRHFGALRRIVFDSLCVPSLAEKGGYDVVVSLTNNGPFRCSAPHVNFQRNSLYYCPYFMENLGGRRNPEVLLRRWLLARTMINADLVVTPTDAMAWMIQAAEPKLDQKRFRTIYHGLSTAHYEEPLTHDTELLLCRQEAKLLYPTHLAVHKGLEILFELLGALKCRQPRFTLFITASEQDWPTGVLRFKKQIKRLGLEENVAFLGRIRQGQMGGLLKRVDLLVYPSLCESFGFAMLEAMAFGVPIVAADTRVNRELCEDAALYYEPFDPLAGALAVEEALNPETARLLRIKAAERMAAFDWGWARYSREFLEVLNSVVRCAPCGTESR
jgi:glycosyltransferase involved in cell wall biosynthesis